jgi:hypothetical protein
MNVQVIKDILEVLDEKSFNPSARHQAKCTNLEQIITISVEKEVFSKFPDLVAGDIAVELTDNIQIDITEILVSWRVWMLTGFSKNIATLTNVKAIIKIQLSAEMLEDQPDEISLLFKEALDIMKEQMDKVKFEFYKKGLEPKIVAPYLRQYAHGKVIQIPIYGMKTKPFVMKVKP